jgi:hypothetical protein
MNLRTGLTDEQHTVLIRVFSNHGHESLVSLAELDIVTLDKQVLPVAKIEIVGEYKHNPLLAHLVDREFIKKDDEIIWKHQWPPEPPANSVDILLTVEDSSELESLRIWPDSLDPTRSIKSVHVYVDDKQVYQGEIESTFGSVVNLAVHGGSELLPEVKALLDAKKSMHEKRMLDDSGHPLPAFEFSALEFQVLDAYTAPQPFALSMIRLYDAGGELITVDPDRAVFETKNCGQCADLSRLFTRISVNLGEGFIPWRGMTLEGMPRLCVRFEEPIKAIAFEIVNADMEHTDEDISVRRMQVLADNRSLWVGTLKRRVQMSMDRKPNSTFIFTVCTTEAKRLVLGDAKDGGR